MRADADQLRVAIARNLRHDLAGRAFRADELDVDAALAQRDHVLGEALGDLGTHRAGDLAELREHRWIGVLDRSVVAGRVHEHELRVSASARDAARCGCVIARSRQIDAAR